MARHTTIVGALAAAALVAVLASCSSDSGSSDDAIDGVQSGEPTASGEASTPESEPTGTDDGIDRPEIRLPENINNVFEPVDTDDPVELAVLADHERRIESVDEVFASGDMSRPALGFYSKGDALRTAVEWVEPAVENGYSFRGTVRYYNREVELLGDAEAQVTYCVDETGIEGIYRETGELRNEGGDTDATGHYAYSTRLAKNDTGVWQTYLLTSEELEGPCT